MDCETLSEAKDTPAVEREDDLVDHVYLYLRDSAYPKRTRNAGATSAAGIRFPGPRSGPGFSD